MIGDDGYERGTTNALIKSIVKLKVRLKLLKPRTRSYGKHWKTLKEK